MTCIIGYFDKENDSVWIGGDSLGSNGYTKAVQNSSKVFRNDTLKDVIMGSTSTFRHIDLLKYSENLFDKLETYEPPEINHKYMVTKFIPKVRSLFKDGICFENDMNKGATFIIGAKNKLFKIQDDYSVLEPQLGFCSVGCGEDIAMGSLITTKDMDMDIPKKIELALSSAEQHSCGVQRPFRIINTVTEEEIIIN